MTTTAPLPLGPGKRSTWTTPIEFWRRLDGEFRFQLDACGTTPLRDDLTTLTEYDQSFWRSWSPGPVWMNPPFGPDLPRFLEKALLERDRGATVVALVPARTDTSWFHSLVLPEASEIRFVRGRLRFGTGAAGEAPFASLIVVYRPTRSPVVFSTIDR